MPVYILNGNKENQMYTTMTSSSSNILHTKFLLSFCPYIYILDAF